MHVEIRKADDGGNWDDAVQKAIGEGSGTSNAAFKAFDDQSASELATLSDTTRTELTDRPARCRRSAGSACRSGSSPHCSPPGACPSDWRSTDEEVR